jgi:small GTP-binding protein
MSTNLIDSIFRVEEILSKIGSSLSADRLAGLRALWESPHLNVVVFGAFNRGKSTLINAILGELILPSKLVPTTGHITRIVYGTKREVRVLLRDGTRETCNFTDLEKFSLLASQNIRDDVDLIEVSCPSPVLQRGVAIIDTPGVQDSELQTRRAEHAVAQAHLILMVLDAQHLLPEWEKIQARRFVARMGKPLVLVVNKMNLVSPSERIEARKRIEVWSQSYVPVEITNLGRSFLEIDALNALRHQLKISPACTDDFSLLKAFVAEMNPICVQHLQSRGNCGVLKSELVRCRSENDREIWRLQIEGDAVEREREEQLRALVVRQHEYNALATANEGALLHFARKKLMAAEASLCASDTTSLECPDCCLTLSEVLKEIQAEAERLASDIDQGILSEPVPFTIAEELCTLLDLDDSSPAIALSRLRVRAIQRLQAQWQLRSREVRRQFSIELDEHRARPKSPGDELRLRQSLDTALNRVDWEQKRLVRLAEVTREAFKRAIDCVTRPLEDCLKAASRIRDDDDAVSIDVFE